jgi:hypothetical protein
MRPFPRPWSAYGRWLAPGVQEEPRRNAVPVGVNRKVGVDDHPEEAEAAEAGSADRVPGRVERVLAQLSRELIEESYADPASAKLRMNVARSMMFMGSTGGSANARSLSRRLTSAEPATAV